MTDTEGAGALSYGETLSATVQSDVRYRVLAENLSDVVWTMSPQGVITYVSPAVEKVRGFTPEEAIAQTIDQILAPESQIESLGYFTTLAEAAAAGRPLPTYRGEQAYLRRDGSIMWADVSAIPLVDEDGTLVEILGVSRDISALREKQDELRRALDEVAALAADLEAANTELRRLATTDPLTGVWNRRHFQEVAQRAIAESRRYGTTLSVLVIDLDHFKRVNDSFGHQVGDDTLVAVSERLMRELREVDVLSRWGGEEFLVLLPQCGLDDAAALADRLRRVLAGSPLLDDVTVTASIGITAYVADDDLDSLVKRADDAVFAAKADGRDRTWLCTLDGLRRSG